METRTFDRQAILPPQPSLSRTLFALASALWFGVVGALYGKIDKLARWARERLVPRLSPDLVAETDSGPRTCVPRAYSGTQLVADTSMRETLPLANRMRRAAHTAAPEAMTSDCDVLAECGALATGSAHLRRLSARHVRC